jgi:hypothetical protein
LVISGRIIWPARSPNSIASSIDLRFCVWRTFSPSPSRSLSFSSHLIPRLLDLVLLLNLCFFLFPSPRFDAYRSASFFLSFIASSPPLDSDCAPFSTGARDRLRHCHLFPTASESTALRDFDGILWQPCLGVTRGYASAHHE